MLLQVDNQQPKQLDQNQQKQNVGGDMGKIERRQQREKHLAQLHHHKAEQPNAQRNHNDVLNGFKHTDHGAAIEPGRPAGGFGKVLHRNCQG
jgi:hypothetical protein